MADLAQGYTADVMLMPGDSVRVSTVGQATVRSAYGAPAGTTTLNANTQTFGPYGVPAKLTITAVSGTANYAQPTQVPVTYDPSTGIVNSPGAVSGAGNRTVVSQPLTVIAVGNSVVDSYGSYVETASCFYPTAILLWGIWFGGLSVRTNRLSAGPASDSNLWDRYGNIGHGGATLDAITQDLFTSGVLTQFATDSFQPDIAALVAGLENDIAGGASIALCTARLDQFVAATRGLWPGTRMFIGTPLPSYSYDTAAKQQVASAVAAYVRALEAANNDIYCVEQGASYADANYLPLALSYVEESSTPGTGTVHPQPRAAVAAGRVWGAKFRAVFGQPALKLTTSNQGLIGSTSAGINGTGVTGTMPTSGGGFSFAVPAWATMVSTAMNPGWRIAITKTAATGTDSNNLPAAALANIPAINGGFCEPYVRMKFTSGASLINGMLILVRAYYTDATNGYIDTFKSRSSDVLNGHGAVFLDGEELLMRLPRCVAAGGKTIQTVTLYVQPYMRDALGTAVIDVSAMGLLA